MTAAELIRPLAEFPGDTPVLIDDSGRDFAAQNLGLRAEGDDIIIAAMPRQDQGQAS
ncbi:MAG: hypothetical protein NUV34_10005 [Sulfuricaulis sp.]|nr:hypothetical protein [Sulfuricaulis sp.]